MKATLATVTLAALFSAAIGAPAEKKRDDNSTLPLIPTPPGAVNPYPNYHAGSQYDYDSFNLVMQIEHIEYTLFGLGLERWNSSDFEAVGLTEDDRALIYWFQLQEIGHEQIVAGLMGEPWLATSRCTYNWPEWNTIWDWLDFNQKATKIGESGVHGFMHHLTDRSAALPLTEAITTEGRQQYSFRQLEGLFPIDVWFETPITQAMTWTLIAPYISSCPAKNPKLNWTNFPALNITNNPAPTTGPKNLAAFANSPPLSQPGRVVNITWEVPGKLVGPDLQYVTRSAASEPKYVAWISQLGLNYTTLDNISGTSGSTVQPGGQLWFNNTLFDTPFVNGTIFIAVVDQIVEPISSYNLSLIESHIVAGPAVYQSG